MDIENATALLAELLAQADAAEQPVLAAKLADCLAFIESLARGEIR